MRKEAEKEIRQELPIKILEAIVEYHCRKGRREGCFCSYCQAKLVATGFVGFIKFPFQIWDEKAKAFRACRPVHDNMSDYYQGLDDLARQCVKDERERKRNIVRADLINTKGEVL